MNTPPPADFRFVTITSPDGQSSASFVPELGGIGCSIVFPGPDGPREALYQHEFFWDRDSRRTRGGWPFLFPACGRLERNGKAGVYLYKGRQYHLPNHGFAMRKPWHDSLSDDHQELQLTLEDDTETFEQYPFRFQVKLTYRMENERLFCDLHIENRSPFPMPFGAGFHPYFLTPPPGEGKEDVQVKHTPYRQYKYNDALTDLIDEVPVYSQPRQLGDPYLDELLTRIPPDNVMRLLIDDRYALYLSVTGTTPGREDLFRYAQHYTMPDRPFFCYEPWTSHPNALNTCYDCIVLEPGATVEGRLELRSKQFLEHTSE